jgi:hypothetical protein
LIPWLKKHRPDIDVQSSKARYRRAKAAEQELKTESESWDEFFRLMTPAARKLYGIVLPEEER